MRRWARFWYQPCLPLGKNGTRVTGSVEHIALSRRAAGEGMVLLKNEKKALPLAAGKRIAVFGKGCADYVKGGGGSGDVTVAMVRTLLDGLRIKAQEGKLQLYEPLARFYEADVCAQYADGILPGLTAEPELPEQLLAGAVAFTDTAVVSLCRFSGENWDRTVEGQKRQASAFQWAEAGMLSRAERVFERGDFYLSAAEQRLVDTVKSHFSQVIVVLNVGGVVDTEWFCAEPRIQAALMAWQGGLEGGLAAADILCGDVNPSGRLADTFAKRLEDYPSTADFHESDSYAEYTEDIYVGYRYFETMPGAKERVNYPFGYGLSYTEFLTEPLGTAWCPGENAVGGQENGSLEVRCAVTNIGGRDGREVVQLYVQAPDGKLGKPARELKAYAKTRLLRPGETQVLRLMVPFSSLASYDDTGKVKKSAWIAERGTYHFYLGANVRDAQKLAYTLGVDQDTVVSQLSAKCVPTLLKKRLLSDGTYEELQRDEAAVRISEWAGPEVAGAREPDNPARQGAVFGEVQKRLQLDAVAEGSITLDTFLEQLSVDDLITLVCGQPNTGVADTFGYGNLPEYGVPNVMTADGPAGLRVRADRGVSTTAFPCATLLACTWDEPLVEEIGAAGAEEVRENNIGVWLTPAINIHRSPLCGRNFEYYSEDPLISGRLGAAMVRGIQSRHVAASVKHFACNNKETLRFESDSRVSERALREIYLKAFEIVVKESDPWTVMTAYNIMNGQRTSENKELLTDILRGEWGFRGMVTTDWWNHAEQYLEIQAGNDVKMGCGYPKRLQKDYEEGRVTADELRICAKRVLELILRLE